MINTVVLTGRLTRDIELKYTGNGTAVANFSLAVNRKFANQQGEREADFINCVIWRKSAENLANFTHKGSLIGVEGSLQTRIYNDNDGKTVYITEVLCNSFTLLESKQNSNYQQPTQQYQQPPMEQNYQQSQPWGTQNISEEDLPF